MSRTLRDVVAIKFQLLIGLNETVLFIYMFWLIKTDPTVNNYVTVPSAVNLFVAAVCWLVCLFFLLFGRTALIGGVKERECEVQVSDMLLLPSIRIDFHGPLVVILTGCHRSLFCNCCCCLFLSSLNSSSWWVNKEEKPCLTIKIFQWGMTTQVSSDPRIALALKLWLGHFFALLILFNTGARQNHI